MTKSITTSWSWLLILTCSCAANPAADTVLPPPRLTTQHTSTVRPPHDPVTTPVSTTKPQRQTLRPTRAEILATEPPPGTPRPKQYQPDDPYAIRIKLDPFGHDTRGWYCYQAYRKQQPSENLHFCHRTVTTCDSKRIHLTQLDPTIGVSKCTRQPIAYCIRVRERSEDIDQYVCGRFVSDCKFHLQRYKIKKQSHMIIQICTERG